MMLMAGLLGGGKAYLDHQLAKQLNQLLAKIAPEMVLHYQSINLSLLGEIVISQVQWYLPNNKQPIEIKNIIVPQAYLLAWHDWDTFPLITRINAKKITLTLPDTTSTPPLLFNLLGYANYYLNFAELHQLGYQQIEADAQMILKVTDNQGQLETQIEAGQWGKLSFAIEMPAIPKPIQFNKQVVKISMMAVKYENKGLIEQWLSFLAKRNGIPLDIFKQTLINKINHDIVQSGVRQEMGLLTHLQRFFDTLIDISVYLYTSKPTTLNTVVTMNPAEMNLKITTDSLM